MKLWSSVLGKLNALLHSAAVVAKDFAFFTQVLRMLFTLVRHVQPIRLLQRSLEQRNWKLMTCIYRNCQLVLGPRKTWETDKLCHLQAYIRIRQRYLQLMYPKFEQFTFLKSVLASMVKLQKSGFDCIDWIHVKIWCAGPMSCPSLLMPCVLMHYLLVRVNVDVALDTFLSHVGPGVPAHPLPLAFWTFILSKTPLFSLIWGQALAFGSSLKRRKIIHAYHHF